MTDCNFNLLLERLAHLSKRMYLAGENQRYDYSQLYVVFEFEGYIPIARLASKPFKIITLSEVDSEEFYSYLVRFFTFDRETFNLSYHQYQEKQGQSLSKEQYCSIRFDNFARLVDWFDATPIFGWYGSPPVGFYTEPVTNDDEYQYYYDQIARHSFFSDKNTVATVVKTLDKDSDSWYIEPDGSLDDRIVEGFIPVEIVSAWISGDRALKTLVAFKRFFESLEGITDADTGLHINVRYRDEREIDWLKLLFLTQDESDLYRFGREDNLCARPVLNRLRSSNFKFLTLWNKTDHSRMTHDTLDKLKDILRQTYEPVKYDAVNLTKFFNDKVNGETTLRQGFVEFRAPGEDYLGARFADSQRILLKYMNLMLAINSIESEREFNLKVVRYYEHLLKPCNIKRNVLRVLVVDMAPHYTISQIFMELKNFLKQQETDRLVILPLFYDLRKKFIRDSLFLVSVFSPDKDTRKVENFWLILLWYKIAEDSKIDRRTKHAALLAQYQKQYQFNIMTSWNRFETEFPTLAKRISSDIK